MNGILLIARSGAAWRDRPERYEAWQTVYKRFVQWQKVGLLERIFHDLGADADLQDISIGSTCIKVTSQAQEPQKRGMQSQNQRQNECIGVSRGERSTKIHAVVDMICPDLWFRSNVRK